MLYTITKEKDVTMICNLDADLVQSRSIQNYIFKGKNGEVRTEDLSVKIYSDDNDLISEYKRIIDDKSECSDIQVSSDSISYHCFYDLVSDHQYYSDIEEDDGTLSFDKLKNELEKDNYVCSYK